jgi:hypothetical protein
MPSSNKELSGGKRVSKKNKKPDTTMVCTKKSDNNVSIGLGVISIMTAIGSLFYALRSSFKHNS